MLGQAGPRVPSRRGCVGVMGGSPCPPPRSYQSPFSSISTVLLSPAPARRSPWGAGPGASGLAPWQMWQGWVGWGVAAPLGSHPQAPSPIPAGPKRPSPPPAAQRQEQGLHLHRDRAGEQLHGFPKRPLRGLVHGLYPQRSAPQSLPQPPEPARSPLHQAPVPRAAALPQQRRAAEAVRVRRLVLSHPPDPSHPCPSPTHVTPGGPWTGPPRRALPSSSSWPLASPDSAPSPGTLQHCFFPVSFLKDALFLYFSWAPRIGWGAHALGTVTGVYSPTQGSLHPWSSIPWYPHSPPSAFTCSPWQPLGDLSPCHRGLGPPDTFPSPTDLALGARDGWDRPRDCGISPPERDGEPVPSPGVSGMLCPSL